nr:Cap [Forsythia suspensa CRESS virus]
MQAQPSQRDSGTNTRRRGPVGRLGGKYQGRLVPRRKVRRGYLGKAQAKGFSIHFEKGGVVSDSYCAYIGHGSCPQVIMRRLMLGCILKTIIRRLGMSISNCNQPLTFLTQNDQILIRIRINVETATEATIAYTLAANQPTFQAVLDGLVNAWVVAVQAQTFESSQEWVLVEAMFSPAGTGDLTAVRIPLENAVLSFSAVSALKVQNRSVPNADDDQSDEVDRIPVKGRIYEFQGSGTHFKRTALAAIGEVNFQPVGEKQDGIFTYSAGVAGGADVLKEPPIPYNFVRCKRASKVNCDPGAIKTSVVKTKRNVSLTSLLRYCVGTNEAAINSTTAVLQNMGNFNLVAMEKLIETSNSASTQVISLAYEVDYKVFGYLIPKLIDNTIGEHYYGTQPS